MSDSLRIIIFGSAAGFPTKERTNTAIGIWREHELHLIDAGEPVAAHLARRGVPPDHLRSVFITHMHADHSSGLPMLLQWLQLNQRGRPLSLYLPGVSAGAFQAVLELHYLFLETLGFELNIHSLKAGQVYEEGGMSLMALESRHLDGQADRLERAGKQPKGHSFSFVITADGKRLFISGDLSQPDEVIIPAAGADLAIVELAHFSPEALGEALSRVEVPRLVVTHLIHSLEAEAESIPARIKAGGYGGEIHVAQDGDEIEL